MAKANQYFFRLKSLATANLFILAIRLVQVFFAGCVTGIMAYYIKLNTGSGEKAPSPFVFSLVVAVSAIVTQLIYCFSFYHRLTFLWDAAVGCGFIISMFWNLNYVSPLSCKWGAFNPFGTDRCAQTRSVLVMQIILAIMWFITSFIGAFQLWRLSKAPAQKLAAEISKA